jgi:hypothetical protein
MSWQDDHWDELGADVLDRDDWQELEDIKEILQPLKDCTMNTQGINATLDISFVNIEFLIHHFTSMREKYINNLQITVRITVAWFKFDKYYSLTENTPVFTAAVLLYPELQQAYLEKV